MENTGEAVMCESHPLLCPSCNGDDIAYILWGLPSDVDGIKKDLAESAIVLGGCLVTDHDPKWECNDCHCRWGERED